MAYYRRSYMKRSKTNSSVLLVVLVCGFVAVMLPAGVLSVLSSRVLPLLALFVLLLAGLFIFLLFWQRRKERERLLALQVSDVDSMEGRDFEGYVAEILRTQGYRIALTKVTGDYGGDIVARKNGVTSVLQLKR